MNAESVPFQPWAQELLRRVHDAQIAEHGDTDRAGWYLLDVMDELAQIGGCRHG